jgi:uncharacterized protein (DUF2237 family)
LTDDNIAELESTGFLWSLQTSKPTQKRTKFEDACFDQRVQELKAYRDTNGHCRVPFLYEPNKALGNWVSTVRTQYTWRGQGKKTSLTDARISELDWKAGTKEKEGSPRDEVWKKRVEELIEYRETYGHCRVPFLYEPNKALGNWVSTVRTQYTWRGQGKKTSLTDTRISELDSVGIVWRLRTKKKEGLAGDELWKKRVEELIEYRDTNGHCRVPVQYTSNKALGNWVSKVRTQYTWRGQGKKTSLTDARISELDSVGIVWRLRTKKKEGSPRDDLWKKRVEELTEYRGTNGHCRVPFVYKPNKALGWWVNKVRTQYTWRGQGKKTSLTDAHISELDSIGFVWKAGTKEKEGSPRDEVWKKRMQELAAFNNKYLEAYSFNPLLLHKQREELLQQLISRRRDYDLYLLALRSYPFCT